MRPEYKPKYMQVNAEYDPWADTWTCTSDRHEFSMPDDQFRAFYGPGNKVANDALKRARDLRNNPPPKPEPAVSDEPEEGVVPEIPEERLAAAADILFSQPEADEGE